MRLWEFKNRFRDQLDKFTSHWNIGKVYEYFDIKPVYSSRETSRMRWREYVKAEDGTMVKTELSNIPQAWNKFRILRN